MDYTIIYSVESIKVSFLTKYEKHRMEFRGEWRKGVAIAFRRNDFRNGAGYISCLVNDKDQVLYEGHGNSSYEENIYRTSLGCYVVTTYIYHSSQDEWVGPVLKCFIDEDGKTKLQDDWFYSQKVSKFIPRELGNGMIEHENVIYRLSDFEQVFRIPSKYRIESTFLDKKFILSVPNDNRDFIVTVKNGKIVYWEDINNLEYIFSLIERTGDNGIIRFCSDKSSIIRAYQSVLNSLGNEYEHHKKERLNPNRSLAPVS